MRGRAVLPLADDSERYLFYLVRLDKKKSRQTYSLLQSLPMTLLALEKLLILHISYKIIDYDDKSVDVIN